MPVERAGFACDVGNEIAAGSKLMSVSETAGKLYYDSNTHDENAS